MINVNVMYPRTEGAKFDFDYYLNRHISLVAKKWSPVLKHIVVEEGVAGGAPGAPATYVCMCSLRFDSVEDFQAVFAATSAEIMADIANYTTISPVIQISAVRQDGQA